MAKGKPFASKNRVPFKKEEKEGKKNPHRKPTEGVDSLETHNQVKTGGGGLTSLYNLSAGLNASS